MWISVIWTQFTLFVEIRVKESRENKHTKLLRSRKQQRKFNMRQTFGNGNGESVSVCLKIHCEEWRFTQWEISSCLSVHVTSRAACKNVFFCLLSEFTSVTTGHESSSTPLRLHVPECDWYSWARCLVLGVKMWTTPAYIKTRELVDSLQLDRHCVTFINCVRCVNTTCFNGRPWCGAHTDLCSDDSNQVYSGKWTEWQEGNMNNIQL